MLEYISLKGFKCFKEKEVFPLKQITVLYGKNGRGKSSLIQALLLMSQTMRLNNNINTLMIKGDLISLELYKDILNSNNDNDGIEIGFKDEEDIRCLFSKYPEKPTLGMLKGLWINNNDFFDVKTDGFNTAEESEGSYSISQSGINGLQNIKKVFYIAANRIGPHNYEDKIDNIEENNVGVRGENVINLLRTKTPQYIENVRQELSDILTGASLNVPKNEESSLVEMFLDSYDDSKGYHPTLVGFGYSYVLPVILLTLLAQKGDIVVIENPEAHLHPAAQSKLIKFIIRHAQEKGFQVILESHSDHVVNGIRIAVKDNIIASTSTNILHFYTEENNVNTSNEIDQPKVEEICVDKHGELSNYPDDFLDEWTKQLLELVK